MKPGDYYYLNFVNHRKVYNTLMYSYGADIDVAVMDFNEDDSTQYL